MRTDQRNSNGRNRSGTSRGQARRDDYYDDRYDARYDDGYGSYDDGYGYDAYPDERVSRSGRSSSRSGNGSRQRQGQRSRRSYGGGNNRRRRRRNSAASVAVIILLIIILGGAFGLKLFLDKYSYSKEKADMKEYFAITDESDVPLVWNNEISETRAKLIDGTYYMDLQSVQKNLNKRFYYGVQNDSDENGMIIYCLPTDKLTVQVGSKDVVSSDGTDTKDYVPAVRDGDTVYLALDFVREYTNFDYATFQGPNRIRITTATDPITTATINKKTQIRKSGGIKSDVLEELDENAKVTVLEQMDTWSKVASEDAIIGYVENKRLGKTEQTTPEPVTDYAEPEFTRKLHGSGGKINMAFHAVFGVGGNDTVWNDTANTKDVNVLAPTWFWVSDNDGNFENAARQDYVDYAHSIGMEVWAVVDNFNSTNLPDHNTFLHTLDARTNLINNLMAQVDAFNLDGINVDFEQIEEDNGQNYIEFIRELSIACRNKGITLSVDDYVPYEFNDFYDIAEQGVFADYVVIMGYDEHYAGSQEAGSVASIGYVTDGIKYAVEKVEKSRVINAIPFYSRIWKTKDGVVTSEAFGMQDIANYISENGMSVSWSTEAGQNYAEQTRDDGTLVQIWIEDTQSIQSKLDAMTAADIGGVAEWKLEFDVPEVWDVIANYMEQ